MVLGLLICLLESQDSNYLCLYLVKGHSFQAVFMNVLLSNGVFSVEFGECCASVGHAAFLTLLLFHWIANSLTKFWTVLVSFSVLKTVLCLPLITILILFYIDTNFDIDIDQNSNKNIPNYDKSLDKKRDKNLIAIIKKLENFDVIIDKNIDKICIKSFMAFFVDFTAMEFMALHTLIKYLIKHCMYWKIGLKLKFTTFSIVGNNFCFSAENFSQIHNELKISVLTFIPQFWLNSFIMSPFHSKNYLNFVLSKNTIKLQYLIINHVQ